MLGAEVYVKHENHLPTGSFKVRGGVNLISQLSGKERRQGVIAASTGNHAQSVAYASQLFGARALIVMPEPANPVKVQATRELGAEVQFYGKDFDDARVHVEALARETGYRYIHSADEPLLVAGVATHTLEILEDQPDIQIIVVPVGGGSGAAGACIVAKTINPKIQVIGVQSENAPAAYRSWKEKRLVEDKTDTFAEGLATRVGFELTQSILGELLDDFILVSESELKQAMVLMIEKTRNLAEAAGASPLAAARKIPHRLEGRKVALILTGANTSLEQLKEALTMS